MQFLQMRHCAENLMFWLDVERYTRLIVEENRRTKAREIYEKYLGKETPCCEWCSVVVSGVVLVVWCEWCSVGGGAVYWCNGDAVLVVVSYE